MLDIRLVKEDPGLIKRELKKRFQENKGHLVDELIRFHEKWRKTKQEIDELNRRRNLLSEEINALKKQSKNTDAKIREAGEIPGKLVSMNKECEELQIRVKKILTQLPNLSHKSVPVGKDESKNKVVRKFGKIIKQKFQLKSHVDLIEDLDLVELERAAKISGARSYYLKNELVQLDLALTQFTLDLMKNKKYTLFRTPDLIKHSAIEGAAELADFETTLYKIENDDLFLIGTAEHTMAALHMNEVLKEKELPLKYCAFSECFRREAGAHGKDSKGIFRVHEFRKVEQFIYCKPEDSWKLHEELIRNAEDLFKKLKIPYRIVDIASGALNNTAARKYDLESWMPAQNTYREMGSCSNCTDYQSRKLNIRYQAKNENKFVHLLNSTAMATPRTIVAVLENFQQKDGVVKVPKVLWKYLDFKEIGGKNGKRR